MGLLAVVLLACGIRRWMDVGERFPVELLWRHWARTGQEQGTGLPRFALAGGLALAVGLASAYLALSGMTWLQRLLELLVLLLTMGMTGWKQTLAAYIRAWRRGDMQAAWHHSQQVLRPAEAARATAPEAMQEAVLGRLLTLVFERYFLLLFWYLVAGPVAVLLVRYWMALVEQKEPDGKSVTEQGYWLLCWLPVHLLALTFSLAGQAKGRLRTVWRQLPVPMEVTRTLQRSAALSLGEGMADPKGFSSRHPAQWPAYAEWSLASVRDLLNRSLMIWLGAIAVLVIIGIF